MSCEHVSSCPLYPHFKLKSLLQYWRLVYCEGDFTRCVRYQRAQRGESVADNVLPNGQPLKIEGPKT